jgi:rsbT co-antagonist protein RsbR
MTAQAKDTGGRTTVKELTIDDREIERRKKCVDFLPDDLKRVQQVRDIVTRHTDELTKKFFDHLSGFNEAKGMLTPSTLEEAKRLKKEHLIAMVSGEYGVRYVEQRLKLGRLYSRAKLDMKVFLGGFHLLMRSVSEKIMSEFTGSPQDAFQAFLAINKIAFLDLAIYIDTIAFDREEIIRQQQEAIRELSTPVLQLRDRLLILPIVGMIDSHRAKLLTEDLLSAIRHNRAKVVVIDITGVAMVDSKVANHLVQTVAASRLMGAQVIVTGLSADVAQVLVTLGVELSSLNTVGDLQGGIEEAERIMSHQQASPDARDTGENWHSRSSANGRQPSATPGK